MIYNWRVARPDYEDTDPDLRPVHAHSLPEEARRPGRRRSIFLPLGMLAVLVLGVHAVADRFADWAFVFISWAAASIESLAGTLANIALSEPEERTRALAEAFDVDRRIELSQWMAFFVEIALVLRLGTACLGAGAARESRLPPGSKGRLGSWSSRFLDWLQTSFGLVRAYLSTLSIEKVYLPLAVAIATLAGVLALFVALDNAFFATSRHLPSSLQPTSWLSPWPAALASLMVLWRLGFPTVTASLARCQLASERDRSAGESTARRTLRGIWGAVLVLPILIVGLFTGTPLGAWVGALWGWSP